MFKLSDKTKKILANFSTINPSLLFNAGKELRTISQDKDILAVAEIEENIPQQFGINDLSKFLSILSTFKDPTIELKEEHAVITAEGKGEYHYRYVDPSFILSPCDNQIKISDPITTFKLGANDLVELTKIMSISKHPEMAFVADGEKLSVQAVDTRDVVKDNYIKELQEEKKTFRFDIKFEKVRVLLPTEYEVMIAKTEGGGWACLFKNTNMNYYMAPEDTSKW